MKTKILTLRTKVSLFFLVFSGWNLEKPLLYLKSTSSNLSYCIVWSKRCLILVFPGRNLKIIFSHLKSWSSTFCNCKISSKKKMPKLSPKVPYWIILDWNFLKLLSYLKSATLICQKLVFNLYGQFRYIVRFFYSSGVHFF